MISADPDLGDSLAVVDGSFRISSDSTDPLAFFNLNLRGKGDDEDQKNAPRHGILPPPGPKWHTKMGDPSSVPLQQRPAPQSKSNGPSCDGKCAACVWSCLCKTGARVLGSLGGGVLPKLG
jgi:hypothetical protein